MGQHYPVSAKLRFLCTNNMAEYESCILGLNIAVDMNIQELLVIGDSDLLLHQHPDKNYIDLIPVRIHNQPAYCAHVEEEADGKPWRPEHANHSKKCTLQRLLNHFFHNEGNLYRRTPDLGLLRCVDAKKGLSHMRTRMLGHAGGT
ncbi:uncharacterized protein [Nicotiana sylvestris]|uniref:uncharacterized protein n=1 Tax=Nicotiana sylvestris TaxID=4096 RepID=UPI00388C3768